MNIFSNSCIPRVVPQSARSPPPGGSWAERYVLHDKSTPKSLSNHLIRSKQYEIHK